MKYYGRASEVSKRILDAFEQGKVPETLAQVFIRHSGNAPSHSWSWSNQLLVALSGSGDARGFRQWKTVKRHVSKGAKAVYILVPLVGKSEDDETGEERSFVYGFKSAPVFRYEDTAGEPLPGREESDKFIEALPLVEVAREWGLTVETFNGASGGTLGYYRGGKAIALGVESLSTWAHELVHAAEYRLRKGLKHGQDLHQETVAELGGAVLLEILGKPVEADRGGAYEYIKAYCDRAGKDPISICHSLLNRVGKAVSLILETADQVQAQPITAVA